MEMAVDKAKTTATVPVPFVALDWARRIASADVSGRRALEQVRVSVGGMNGWRIEACDGHRLIRFESVAYDSTHAAHGLYPAKGIPSVKSQGDVLASGDGLVSPLGVTLAPSTDAGTWPNLDLVIPALTINPPEGAGSDFGINPGLLGGLMDAVATVHKKTTRGSKPATVRVHPTGPGTGIRFDANWGEIRCVAVLMPIKLPTLDD